MDAKLLQAIERVREIGQMPDGWDGHDARAIPEETCVQVITFLAQHIPDWRDILPIPDISAEPVGTISLEWENDRGYAHLEIGQKRFSFHVIPTSGDKIFLDGLVNNGEIGLAVLDVVYVMYTNNSDMIHACDVSTRESRQHVA